MIAYQRYYLSMNILYWPIISVLLIFCVSCDSEHHRVDARGDEAGTKIGRDAEGSENDAYTKDSEDENTRLDRTCTNSVLDPSAVYFYSATRLAAAIRDGDITSTEILELYLDRIERFNSEINAVVVLDVERARESAAAADRALSEGKSWGPLHGLPITIKDTFEVAGIVTTSGDSELKDYIPESNAIAVQRLVDAGAIVFGKTNVSYHATDIQSYNDVYGTTNNPWDLDKTAGGSSGGAAAALAAGLTAVELGSDIGGSIRIPSNFNGIFGHKPSYGVVPRYGHIPPLPGTATKEQADRTPLFVVGPLARSADDLELALELLSTPGETESEQETPELLPPRKQKFTDYRVAVWFQDPPPFSESQDEVLSLLNRAADKLVEAGLEVDKDARPDIDLSRDIQMFMQSFNADRNPIIPAPDAVTQYQEAQRTKWDVFFQDYDVLLVPVTPMIAFPHDHSEPIITRILTIEGKEASYSLAYLNYITMAVISGLPATVAPVGIGESCLPVGIQIIGGYLEDRTTIDFARGLSELIGGFVPPPDYQ